MNVRNIYLNLFLDRDCLLKVGCSWSFLRHIQTTDTRTVTKTNKLVKNKNPFMTGRNSTFYSTQEPVLLKNQFFLESFFFVIVCYFFSMLSNIIQWNIKNIRVATAMDFKGNCTTCDKQYDSNSFSRLTLSSAIPAKYQLVCRLPKYLSKVLHCNGNNW